MPLMTLKRGDPQSSAGISVKMQNSKKMRFIDANLPLIHANTPCENITLFTKIIFMYTQNGICSHLLRLMSVPITKLLRRIIVTAFLHTDILQNGRKWMKTEPDIWNS